MPYAEMQHDDDAKQAVRDRIGDVSGVELFGTQVLVGIYVRPERTASGIFLTDGTRKEDVYQGKVGLVLKVGPLAFKDTDNFKFEGRCAAEGDWVIFKVGDAWPVTFNSKDGECRILEDIHVRATVTQPDHVW